MGGSAHCDDTHGSSTLKSQKNVRFVELSNLNNMNSLRFGRWVSKIANSSNYIFSTRSKARILTQCLRQKPGRIKGVEGSQYSWTSFWGERQLYPPTCGRDPFTDALDAISPEFGRLIVFRSMADVERAFDSL